MTERFEISNAPVSGRPRLGIVASWLLLGVVAVVSGYPRLGAGIFMGDAEFTCRECDTAQVLPAFVDLDS